MGQHHDPQLVYFDRSASSSGDDRQPFDWRPILVTVRDEAPRGDYSRSAYECRDVDEQSDQRHCKRDDRQGHHHDADATATRSSRRSCRLAVSPYATVAGMALNLWWKDSPAERYWLETTQRPDVGVDLNAPADNYKGDEYWSYALVREVQDGDVVFHWEKGEGAIRRWSRATGGWWPDMVFWGARGTVSRSSDPYDRPGVRHGLDGPFELEEPITLDMLRERQSAIRAARDEVARTYPGSIYFPFELSDLRPARTAQGYLFKFPNALTGVFPELYVPAFSSRPAPGPPLSSSSANAPPGPLGVEYRRPDEAAAMGQRDPFAVDPAVVERGTRAHAATQNALADYLLSQGVQPRSPSPSEPNFDLAWETGGQKFVAEVKSLTVRNEERQLRLGLGQLLRYRALLASDAPVRAVLMAERRPTDSTWDDLCTELGASLTWPGVLSDRLS